jgi:serine/threonine protein kinase
MEALRLDAEDSRALPLGTRIGPWRVVGFGDRGVFGIVYRAVRVGREKDGPVALKVAVYPRDPRFEREAWLLRNVRHPSVPRLLDAGQLRHASGFLHPYLVMEWIQGETLYAWASRRNPSSYQVMRLLAQGAWALHATHAIGAVHRDVKGENMLVRPANAQLFLMDFGVGHYPGAERLTPTALPPGTRAYNGPEVWDYARRYGHNPYALYVAGPADDVFAFGVMTYRLVTDEYPPFTDSSRPEGQCWQPGGSGPRPPKELNPRVDPQLDALILRALSLKREERGTAEELAEALEQRVAQAGPEAHVPLFEWETQERAQWSLEDIASAGFSGHRPRRRAREEVQATEPISSQSHTQPSHTWRAMAAAGLALAVWAWWAAPSQSGEEPPLAQAEPAQGDPPDAGTAGLGEALASASTEPSPELRAMEVMAEETPPEPQPGQARPDAKGRCPRRRQVILNGSCWAEFPSDATECEEKGGYFYKKACYLPFYSSGRPPTSSPTDKP